MPYIKNPDDRAGVSGGFRQRALENQKYGQGASPLYISPDRPVGASAIRAYGWREVEISKGDMVFSNQGIMYQTLHEEKFPDPDLSGYSLGVYSGYDYGT